MGVRAKHSSKCRANVEWLMAAMLEGMSTDPISFDQSIYGVLCPHRSPCFVNCDVGKGTSAGRQAKSQ